MYILANMWFTTLMRQFFFNIDRIVFNFISLIYDLLITIARTSPLSQADIADLTGRIYKLLAVFMIFKVILSLITYVVNPDDFSDKSKGVGKLTTNIIISLSLLILTPYIFSYAYQIQTIILEDNSLGTLVFGEKNDGYFYTTAGEDMAYLIMAPFFTPDTSIEALTECSQLTTKKTNGKVVFNNKCSGLKEDFSQDTNIDSEKSLYSLTDDKKGRFTVQTLKNYVAGVQTNSLPLMFRQDMAVATDAKNEFYIMDYRYLFSTAVGVIVVLLLISFSMDVAVRSIKLAFLQLIAPIPIISYVDPKSGKDGMFKKWYEMCFKTYLSLFIRLLAIYFAVYIISLVADGKLVDIVNGSYVTNAFVIIFIIIGALMFAKQLPEILKGFGFELDGGFQLNPLKKIEKDALGGKAISKAAGVPLKYGGRAAKGLGTAALVGGASLATGQGFRGTGTAFANAMKGKKFGENFTNSYAAAKARNKQVQEMRAEGVDPFEVAMEKFRNKFQGTTAAEKVNQVENKAKAIQSYYENIKNQAIACDSNDSTAIEREMKDASGKIVKRKIESAKTIAKELDEMKKTQIDRSAFGDDAAGEAAYNAAITQQKNLIKEKEADLEFRINALANGTVKTGVDSADKVIKESAKAMGQLAISVNEIGKSVDSEFVAMTTDTKDVVKMMKESKGAVAQTTSGKMDHIKDVAKYTNKPK